MEIVRIPLPIPVSQVSEIERYMASRAVILAPFNDDPKVVYSVITYLEQEVFHETITNVLIDRQVLSFIKQIATGKPISDQDCRLASATMCFVLLGRFAVEPNMALYEYSDTNPSSQAWRDVCIFRHANRLDFSIWHSLFLGTTKAIPTAKRFTTEQCLPPQDVDFKSPLRLFSFCHTFVLKLANIERGGGRPVEKMLGYLDWMHDEYLFGAPATLFGSLFLSPSRKSNMIKNAGSSDRTKRLAGIRNACWDLVFIQQWLECVKKQAATHDLWLACSNDAALLKTAGRIYASTSASAHELKNRLREAFVQDWGMNGSTIFEHYCNLERTQPSPSRLANQKVSPDHWKALRKKLEDQL